jgi:hypothetical protein
VIPFLENVLRGRNVPRERMLQVAEHYYHFGGRSPINDHCRELILALQSEVSLPVYWGNRNWYPMLGGAVRQMAADGIRRALAIATSAYSSYSGCRQYREFAMASGEMNRREFTDFLRRSCQLMVQNSSDGAIHFICMDFRHQSELLDAGSSVYSELKNLCVWVKNNGGMGSLYRSRHELIFVYKAGTGQHQNHVELGRFGRNRTNVWEYPVVRAFGGDQDEEGDLLAQHPTPKPVALIADALMDVSTRGDLVLDPFLGSGSTLIAAERVGRVARGIELDGRYVDLSIRRWERLTKRSAVHATLQMTFQEVQAMRGEESHD